MRSLFQQVPPHETRSFIIWRGDLKDRLYEASIAFNIYNVFLICERQEDFLHSWAFGTPLGNNHIINDYINHKHIFEGIVKYFKQASSSIIANGNKARYIHNYEVPKYSPEFDQVLKNFQIDLLKQSTPDRNHKAYLTKQEVTCIRYLNQGKSAKEIAAILSLSPRTVESYLQNARQRLDFCNKSQLLTFFKEWYL